MKLKRQSKIIELIIERDIETQEELGEELRASGFPVTQATISRDIKELGLIKIQTTQGRQKYAVLPAVETQISERLIRVFCDGVVSVDFAQNIIVIKTLDGMAQAVGASLDAMNRKEIIGTLAGDDTLFCVAKNEEQALALINGLNSILYSERI